LAELTGQRAELAARTVNLRREMLEVVRRQVASGLKPSIEADMAELAKGDAEVDHHRLSAQVETALLGLSRLINLQGGSGFTLVPSLSATSDPSFPPPEASLVAARAMENHPGLAAQAAACQSVDADRAVATNQRYPWLSSIQVSRRLSRPSDAGNWSVQVGVNLPLFRSPAAAAERIAAVRHQGCLLELEALRSRIRREAEESAEALRQAAGQLARLNALATETATRVLEQTRKALATGLADRFDLLTAEARQLSLRDRWFQHRLEYATLEQRLELAIGGPLDTP
jgi:outer membrane protein TolC